MRRTSLPWLRRQLVDVATEVYDTQGKFVSIFLQFLACFLLNPEGLWDIFQTYMVYSLGTTLTMSAKRVIIVFKTPAILLHALKYYTSKKSFVKKRNKANTQHLVLT